MVGVQIERPSACAAAELADFAGLVREGFRGSDDTLDDRIRRARFLAFHRADDGATAGIAGLKAPAVRHREEVFANAGVGADPAVHEMELGWVYVVPTHRGAGIGETLCRRLLARVPATSVFATTRPDNGPMIRILQRLRFARVGRPYRRRGEELAVYVREPARNAPEALLPPESR